MTFLKIVAWLILWPILLPMLIWRSKLDVSYKILLTGAVYIVLILIIIFRLSTKSKPAEEEFIPTSTAALLIAPKPTSTPTPYVSIMKLTMDAFHSSRKTIHIDGKNFGDYGKTVVTNAGTENQLFYIGYFLPAGTWSATNNSNHADQLSVLSPDTKRENGIESPAEGETYQFQPGETKRINIPSGWYVKVSSPSDFTIK
jgi:hypothetical protein